ncbi:Two-component response regulator, FixJ family, consists of REC and HTH domains [Variovorax sp. YR216]|nr:Two-component response regulator, FixJ family, consists of REC and HTH domains [Variovorax sp. YR216]
MGAHPGCIVLGVRMLGPGGLDLHALLASQSDLPVILVTASTTAREVVRAMKQGAADLFCKPWDDEAFLSAVNKAVTEHRSRAETREKQAALQLRRESLSRREMEVFDLMILGVTSRGICEQLGLAERTLKHHRSRVMQKMGVKSVIELVLAVEGSKDRPSHPTRNIDHATP